MDRLLKKIVFLYNANFSDYFWKISKALDFVKLNEIADEDKHTFVGMLLMQYEKALYNMTLLKSMQCIDFNNKKGFNEIIKKVYSGMEIPKDVKNMIFRIKKDFLFHIFKYEKFGYIDRLNEEFMLCWSINEFNALCVEYFSHKADTITTIEEFKSLQNCWENFAEGGHGRNLSQASIVKIRKKVEGMP
ncbi:MAG: hypothetical protein PHO23_01690 [Candidatus Pacebacteria bacterium]|nr:hypothetical protein [Candidatus Paceibacterota bacterium]